MTGTSRRDFFKGAAAIAATGALAMRRVRPSAAKAWEERDDDVFK